jgi:hypothetical protein
MNSEELCTSHCEQKSAVTVLDPSSSSLLPLRIIQKDVAESRVGTTISLLVSYTLCSTPFLIPELLRCVTLLQCELSSCLLFAARSLGYHCTYPDIWPFVCRCSGSTHCGGCPVFRAATLSCFVHCSRAIALFLILVVLFPSSQPLT